MRGLLAEFGINVPEGLERALLLARQIVAGESPSVPAAAIEMVGMLAQQALDTHSRLQEIDRKLGALQKSDEMAKRIATIPGIGPVGATALAAAVTDPGQFRSGRQFAAWLGLTPPEFQRRQGAARWYIKDGRQVFASAIRDRRNVSGSASTTQTGNRRPALGRTSCPQAGAGCHCRNGKQDGRHRLGDYDARQSVRAIPCADARRVSARSSLKETSFRRLLGRCEVMARPIGPGTGTTHRVSKAS